MLASTLFIGLLIGVLFGMPVGAVGAMTMQRILTHGPRAGFISGMGSSAADCMYASVGAFGITLISNFLTAHQLVITILGSILISIMGIRMLIQNASGANAQVESFNATRFFCRLLRWELQIQLQFLPFYLRFLILAFPDK